MRGSASSRWFVVQTHPRAEFKAETNLMRQGFRIYLPRYLKKRRHARSVDIVTAPLFPRYLFVAIDMATQRWYSIRSTFGVAQLVCSGEKPVPISTGIIDELREREDKYGFIQLPKHPRFFAGDKVRLIEGAFSNSIALFEGMSDSERVSVLLDLLGRKVRVLLNADMIVAA